MPHPDRRPRILLIGCSGQLGWELRRSLAPLGEVTAASDCGRYGPRLDLTDPDGLRTLIRTTAPELILNAAAYTAVDKAETDLERAEAINAQAPGLIGEAAKELGALVVHYSTDFVFDGTASRPYREEEPTGPLGVYGRTKLQGEQALLAATERALVLRTSWVYGLRGQNFLLTMQRLFRERPLVRVVDDQIGSPTWSRHLADVTAQLLSQLWRDDFDLRGRGGVYHVCGAGHTSWYGFARAIWELSGASCQLGPIPTSEYPTPARRPAYSVLDTSKLWRTFGLRLPPWRESLELCLQDQQEFAARV